MKITVLFGLLTSGSAALLYLAGALYPMGLHLQSYFVAALASGWLGILYGGILRMLGQALRWNQIGPTEDTSRGSGEDTVA